MTLLTGQDYPIKALAEIEAFLAARPGESFIESHPIPSPNHWAAEGGGSDRLERAHLWAGGRVVRLPRPRHSPPLGLAPRGGLAYWTIARAAAAHAVALVDRHPALLRWFTRIWVPDEAFFQTVLAASSHPVVDDPLRYVVFAPGAKSPGVLTLEDLPALRSTTPTALFARKFDHEVDAAVLDALDRL